MADGPAANRLKDDVDMIMLTRLNGAPFALNPDLLERAEETPDTVLTLCDGSKLVVAESLTQLVERVRDYRASVICRAEGLSLPGASAPALTVVPYPGKGV